MSALTKKDFNALATILRRHNASGVNPAFSYTKFLVAAKPPSPKSPRDDAYEDKLTENFREHF